MFRIQSGSLCASAEMAENAGRGRQRRQMRAAVADPDSFVIGKPFFPEDSPVPVVRCSGSGFLKASASGIDDICMHRESRGGADGFPNERMRQMESRIRSSGIRDRLMKSASGFSRRRKSREISFSAMASGGTKKVVRLGCR